MILPDHLRPLPTSLEAAYGAAHESVVWCDHGARGLLRLGGKTRLDLIHRMSTQAVAALQPGEGAATVLTTEIGRIIDRVIVYAATDFAQVLAGEGHADALVRYLRRNVFFNDDVQVGDMGRETVVFGVYGPRAGEVLDALGFRARDLPLHHWRAVETGAIAGAGGDSAAIASTFAGPHVTLHRADPIAGDGYYIMAPAAAAESLVALLARSSGPMLDEAAYDYLRIEAGLPRFGRELTLDYIPLEAGLWDDVSFHKGCYTGQEIIARMESRGKLAKRLARLRPASPVAAGAEIVANGRPVGAITSVAGGPAGLVALGYVKAAVLDQGAELAAGDMPIAVR